MLSGLDLGGLKSRLGEGLKQHLSWCYLADGCCEPRGRNNPPVLKLTAILRNLALWAEHPVALSPMTPRP